MNRREFNGWIAFASLFAQHIADAQAFNKASILLPNAQRSYDIGHGTAHILAVAEETEGKWWLGSIESDAHRKTSLHIHHSADEYIYVLEGVLSVWLENRWQDLPVGGVTIVPRGIQHALGNRSEQPMRYLLAGTPAGFEHFFADIEIAARKDPYGSQAFLAALSEIYLKYDSKLLGTPPAG